MKHARQKKNLKNEEDRGARALKSNAIIPVGKVPAGSKTGGWKEASEATKHTGSVSHDR